jgi:hypothetical protein
VELLGAGEKLCQLGITGIPEIAIEGGLHYSANGNQITIYLGILESSGKYTGKNLGSK